MQPLALEVGQQDLRVATELLEARTQVGIKTGLVSILWLKERPRKEERHNKEDCEKKSGCFPHMIRP